MRMAHRQGLFGRGGSNYLFKDGVINNQVWTGSNGTYSDYRITDVLHVDLTIPAGDVASAGNAALVWQGNLSKVTTLHFLAKSWHYYDSTAPNIRVNGNYVTIPPSGANYELTYDLSQLADRANVTILIQSGRVQGAGLKQAGIEVSKVWAT